MPVFATCSPSWCWWVSLAFFPVLPPSIGPQFVLSLVAIAQHSVAAELRHPCRKRLPSSFHAGSGCIIFWLANVFRFDQGRRRPHNPLDDLRHIVFLTLRHILNPEVWSAAAIAKHRLRSSFADRRFGSWRLRAFEPGQFVFTVFYSDRNAIIEPPPYMLVAVARDSESVTIIEPVHQSRYCILGRK